MKSTNMESALNDPLTRIQREINEVTKREHEFKTERSMKYNNNINNVALNAQANNNVDDTHSKISLLPNLEPKTPVNNYNMSAPQLVAPSRRFSTNPNQKGLMQRFIASRGKLSLNSIAVKSPERQFVPPAVISPPVVQKSSNFKPIRKGYTPVEEKIQKELQEMKNRESELKKIRRQSMGSSQLDLLNYVDYEMMSDEEVDIPPPGKLRTCKSIGELCEQLNGGAVSPSPSTSSSPDRLKPAKSLAQLCDLDETETPSSRRLIAEWESMIQKKQDVGLTA